MDISRVGSILEAAYPLGAASTYLVISQGNYSPTLSVWKILIESLLKFIELYSLNEKGLIWEANKKTYFWILSHFEKKLFKDILFIY